MEADCRRERPVQPRPLPRIRLRLHPNLWEKALALEANSMARNPRDFLGTDKPIGKLLSEGRQPMLDGFLEAEAGCRSGYCFV